MRFLLSKFKSLSKIAVSIAVLFCALMLRVYDPAIIKNIRSWTFDSYQRQLPREYVDLPVKVIDIDDKSLEQLGQWPWPRTQVANLIDNLAERGVSTIVFDFVFSEPDRTSPSRVLEQLSDSEIGSATIKLLLKLPDNDQRLAKSLSKSNVVLGFAFSINEDSRLPKSKAGIGYGGDHPKYFIPNFPGAVANLEVLETATNGIGSMNMAAEGDGVVRRIPMIFAIEDRLYPSLVLESLRIAQGAGSMSVRSSGASGVESYGEKTGIISVRVGDFEIPTNSDGSLSVYYSNASDKRTIPAWKLFDSSQKLDDLSGQIVIIGTSAAGLKDIRATPFNAFEAGVQIHAEALEQVLTGAYIVRPDWMDGAEIVGLFIFGILLIIMLAKFNSKWSGLIVILFLASSVGVSWNAFVQNGYLVDPLFGGITIFMIYLSETIRQHLKADKEKREIRGAFNYYLSPELVEEIAKDPSRLSLGGESRPLTVLFSDIQGFTTISEKLQPQELTSLINRFLTPLTDTILHAKGTIDKYIGDAIMAFWNAPLDCADHERQACLTALKMQQDLLDLNIVLEKEAAEEEREFIPLKAGIGINSGECCVGNFGSKQRFAYSALGDSVNISARFEGQTRVYGVNIIAGAQTCENAQDLAYVILDLLRVKGKKQPVTIYALLGDDTFAVSQDFQFGKNTHEKFWQAYLAQEWDKALAAIVKARSNQDVGLFRYYDMMENRIKEYQQQPLIEEWDGVYTATTK